MSRRRSRDRARAIPLASQKESDELRRPNQWIRFVGAILLVGAAWLGLSGGYQLWQRERTVGEAIRLIQQRAYTPEMFQLLNRALQIYPSDGTARYLLGHSIFYLEQLKDRPGDTSQINLGNLDVAAEYLTESLRTTVLPSWPLLALAQARLFGARIAQAENNPAYVGPFASEAVKDFLNAFEVNPDPPGNPSDLWIETARAAELVGRPDAVLYALTRLDTRKDQPPSPALAARVPALRQNAAYTMANAALLTDVLYRRWLASPDDTQIWQQMALLAGVPGGQAASKRLLEHLRERFPDNEAARSPGTRGTQTKPIQEPEPSSP